MSKNKNINEEDFRRYIENRMRETERNRFERELQKHPFEAEALEGFEQLSSGQMQDDLKELKNKIRRHKRNNIYRWWAVAASFVLLIATGIFLFRVNEKDLTPEMAELKTEKKQEKRIPKLEPQQENKANKQLESDKKKVDTAKTISADKIRKAKEDITSVLAEEEEKMIIANGGEKPRETATEEKAAKNVIIRGVSTLKAEKTTKLDTESLTHQANSKSLTQKAAFSVDKNDVYPDSFSNVSSREQQKIQELTGVAAQDQVAEETSIILQDVDALPEGGMEKFQKYLEIKAILPAGFSGNRKTIKITLLIDRNGKIATIENRNRADSTLYERAKKIIENGPGWNPEIKDGQPVPSKVRLKIVFTKK